jgi:Nucleotidyl transferase of unknown function (DUF2204)
MTIARAATIRQSLWLRDEALLMLEGRGAVLETARDISRILQENEIAGAVIGGVSVTLHGHVRATSDVDVFVPEPLATFAEHLRAAGYDFDPHQREFIQEKVPVHLVPPSHAFPIPSHFTVIDDVRTVSLADLINLKLRSGLSSVLRSQDLADVIALIRVNKLDGRFASRISKPLRAEFRRLLAAVRSDRKNRRNDGGNPYSHPA